MTQEQFGYLETWFEEASALEPAARASVLEIAERTAPGVLDDLRRMLAAYDEESGGGEPAGAYTEPAWRPRAYGPWWAERLLGRGGTGSVFLARRADGRYEREVALKALAPYLADDSFEQRFPSEGRILATLSHPNIALMLDGGVADDGTPFLVMEHVEGEDIRAYCDRHSLPIEERIGLFLQVCSAVSYAHQCLVLHRDLKPSNILVTELGQVRLLDFGAAMILSPAGGEGSRTGAGLMTPRYASPEQMRQAPLGTSSDVYSLGVVLYELLAGTGPFGDGQSTLGDFLRLAENRSPIPLGEALGEDAAARRQLPGKRLRRVLSGDLRLILAKCLLADSRERYQTADALAADLRAFLAHRPVSQRPPAAGYRSGLFVRRHRAGVALASAAAAALTAGVAGVAWQSALAQRRFEEVRSLAHFQVFELIDGLEALSGSRKLRRNVVEHSMQYLDALGREAGRDVALKVEIAEGYLRLGDLYANSGFAVGPRGNEQAQQAYDKGRLIAREIETPAGRRTLAMLELNAGSMAINASKSAVRAAAQKAGAAVRQAIAQAPGEPSNYIYLGNILSQADEKLRSAGGMLDGAPEGLPNFDAALAAYRQAQQLGARPDQVKRLIWQLDSRQAFVLSSTNPNRAIELARTTLDEIAAASPEVRNDARVRRIEAQLYDHIGWAGGQALRFDLSEQASRRAVDVLNHLLAEDPDNPRILYELSGAYRSQGIVAGYAKQYRGAIEAFERAIAMHNAILRGGPNTQSEFLRAELTGRIAGHWDILGNSYKAAAAARQAETWLRELCAVPLPNPSHLYALTNLLASNKHVSNPPDALRYAMEAQRQQPGPLNEQAVVRALILNGRLDEAERKLAPLEQQALALSEGKDSRLRQVLATMREELESRRGSQAAAGRTSRSDRRSR